MFNFFCRQVAAFAFKKVKEQTHEPQKKITLLKAVWENNEFCKMNLEKTNVSII